MELLSGIPWETVLKGMDTEQSWQIKGTLLGVQCLSIPRQKKLSKGGRRPLWLCKDLQLKLREKKGNVQKKRRKCTESGSRVVYAEGNAGLLSKCVEIGLGKPRHRWS